MNLSLYVTALAIVLVASTTSAFPDKRGTGAKSRRALSQREAQTLVRALYRRGWWSDTWNKVKEGAQDIGGHVSEGLDKLKEGAENAWNKVKEGAGNAWNKIKEEWEEFKDQHTIHGRELSSDDATASKEDRDISQEDFESAMKRLADETRGMSSFLRAVAASEYDADRRRGPETQENEERKRIYYPPPDFDFFPSLSQSRLSLP